MCCILAGVTLSTTDMAGVMVGAGMISLNPEQAGRVITGLIVGMVLVGFLFLLVLLCLVVTKVKASKQKNRDLDRLSMTQM